MSGVKKGDKYVCIITEQDSMTQPPFTTFAFECEKIDSSKKIYLKQHSNFITDWNPKDDK